MPKALTITEADILDSIVGLEPSTFRPEVARQFLKLKFAPATTRRIRRLLRENNRGTITTDNRLLLERYLHVGQFIDLLRAKAQLALHENGRKH